MVANQVLAEDLVLVLGQQDRMQRGGDTWNFPVPYDKLAVRLLPTPPPPPPIQVKARYGPYT
jgi:hypothetical protein